MSATTFIYCLCEPGTKTIRYVGKADNPKKRLANHLAVARRGGKTSHTLHWLQKLLSQGTKPELFVIGEIPVSGWEEYEKNAIAAARALGMALTNTTDGGEGVKGLTGEKHPWFGKHHTPESKAKMRAGNLGKKASVETKAKFSEARAGKLNPMFGRRGNKSPIFGRKHTPEELVKMSLVNAGENHPQFGKTGKKNPNFNKKSKNNISGFVGVGKVRKGWRARVNKIELRFSKREDAVFARNLMVANL